MSLRLIKITKDHYNILKDMLDEWNDDIVKNKTNHSPYAIFKNDYKDYDYYLSNLENLHDNDRYVSDSVYFLYDDENDKLIGAVNIRHHLNERLLLDGGHIGDGIRPSERGKGYGNLILKLALDECFKMGIYKVLVTCSPDNVASKKAILYNGGVLENTIEVDGEYTDRYWIDLIKIRSKVEKVKVIHKKSNKNNLTGEDIDLLNDSKEILTNSICDDHMDGA